MSDDDWEPWVEHDGKGCPDSIAGKWIQVVAEHGPKGILAGQIETQEGVADPCHAEWDWKNFGILAPIGVYVARILRYRVRKPKGLELLRAIAADPPPLPQPKELEPA